MLVQPAADIQQGAMKTTLDGALQARLKWLVGMGYALIGAIK